VEKVVALISGSSAAKKRSDDFEVLVIGRQGLASRYVFTINVVGAKAR
jgi:hypothetical protein